MVPSPVKKFLTMRLLFLVLLVIVCIECGKRNKGGKKNKDGKKDKGEQLPDTITVDDEEMEREPEVITVDDKEIDEKSALIPVDVEVADEIHEEEEEDEPAFCSHTILGMEMRLNPGTTFRNPMDQCEIVQCLEGGELEVTNVPVNPLGVKTFHEVLIHNPSGIFKGKPCKDCKCIGMGMHFLSCSESKDCDHPVNDAA